MIEVDESCLEPLAEIIRLAWDAAATVESVRRARETAARANPHGAGLPIPTFLFMMGDRPLGHMTTVPTILWVDGREHRAHWFKGFWVVPEHRNGPVGFMLARESLRYLDTVLSMVVQPAPRRLFQSIGLRDLGVMPNYLCVLRPKRLMRRLAGADLASVGPRWAAPLLRLLAKPGLVHATATLSSVGMRTWTLSLPAGVGVAAQEPTSLDPAAVDALWRRSREALRAAPVRDAKHLHARALNRPGSYVAAAVEEAGELAAMALIRRPRPEGDPRLNGAQVATLADFLWVPDQRSAALRLLAGAETIAADLGADALLCSATHGGLPWLLRRRGYFALGGNVHFMARSQGFGMESLGLTDWWLTRADGEADDAF